MTNSRTPADGEQPPLALPNRELLERLGAIAHRLGTRSFLVGGPVRDLILGRTQPREETGTHHKGTKTQSNPESGALVTSCLGGSIPDSVFLSDIDVAVEDSSREFGAAVAKEFGGCFVFHSRFLTGTVSFPEQPAGKLGTVPRSASVGHARGIVGTSGAGQSPFSSAPSSPAPRTTSLAHIDITQTRAETYERPAVLPAVRPASIVGDLGRRDFTVNAMALEITPASFGTFIDPFDGRADVTQRRVRVLHARSFIDDPTRIFRCIRFATRLGFKIERQTLDLMRSAVEQRLPAFLTPERVLYELRLICVEPLVLPMVRTLIRERVLEATWRWNSPRGFVDDMAKLTRQAKSLGTVPGAGAPQSGTVPGFRAADLLFIYWLSVLPVTDRFPVRKEERDAAEAVAAFDKLKPKLRRRLTPSAVYRILRSVSEPALAILATIETGTVSTNIRAFLDDYSKVRIASTGADLRAAGLKPGPAYRAILDELLFARLDGRIRTVTEEHALLQRLAKQTGG